MRADPAPVRQPLLLPALRRAMFGQPLGQPRFLAAQRIDMLPRRHTRAQNLFEPRPRRDGRCRPGIDVPISLIAQQQPVLPVKDHESIRDRLDRRAQPHLGGDVDGHRHQIAILRAPILQPHPQTRVKGQLHRRDRLCLQPRQHPLRPIPRRFRAQNQQRRDQRQQIAIGQSGGHRPRRKRAQKGAIGQNHPPLGVKDGKAVADRVDAFAQPPLGHDGGGMGAVKIAQIAQVLPLQPLSLGSCRMGGLALFDHLFGQAARLQRQLLVGREQLAALPFQQALGGQPRPPLLRQPFHHVHAARPASAGAGGHPRRWR